MSKKVYYEWDIETIEYDTEEVIEHDHVYRLNSFSAQRVEAALSPRQGSEEFGTDLVLVRDDLEVGRLWAYEEGGQLPEFFSDSLGHPTGYRVPVRFHREFQACLATLAGR